MDEDSFDSYLEKLDAFLEGESCTTLSSELAERRETPPPLEDLRTDEEVLLALTNLIWALFDLGVLIEDADHLSDRELYATLLEGLDEPTVVFPDDPDAWCHWSPIGGCSEEDIEISLRYYDDEKTRAEWAEMFPDMFIPPSELPPYPRPWLPQYR